MLKTQEMRFQHSQKLFIVAPRHFCGAFQLLLRFGRIFFNMFFNCREALRTDIVFNPARVIESCLLIDTEIHQPFGEGSVALIDRLCDPAAIGRINDEQLLKLRTLGLTEEEAESVIIENFLN